MITMSNGNDLTADGTQVQRLDRIEQKVTEFGAKADEATRRAHEAAKIAQTAAQDARSAVSTAAEVNRAAAESFRATTKTLDEMSTVLFGYALFPDGGSLGRINTKLDAITQATIKDEEQGRTSRAANKLQLRYLAIYFAGALLLTIIAGIVGAAISHAHL